MNNFDCTDPDFNTLVASISGKFSNLRKDLLLRTYDKEVARLMLCLVPHAIFNDLPAMQSVHRLDDEAFEKLQEGYTHIKRHELLIAGSLKAVAEKLNAANRLAVSDRQYTADFAALSPPPSSIH